MGLFDKIRDSINGDEKPKHFEATFSQDRLGMTLESGAQGKAVVTAGQSLRRVGKPEASWSNDE